MNCPGLVRVAYIRVTDLVMLKQALSTAPFDKLWNAALRILQENRLEDNSKPMPDFTLKRRILEPGDDFLRKGLHDTDLCDRMEDRQLLRPEGDDRDLGVVKAVNRSAQAIFPDDVGDALEGGDQDEAHRQCSDWDAPDRGEEMGSLVGWFLQTP